MNKLLITLCLLLAAPRAPSQTSGKPCAKPDVANISEESSWMDRNCKVHPRADLDAILQRHQQWIDKYREDIGKLKNERISKLPDKARMDPLLADLSGADLTGTSFFGADLTGADLTGADLSRTSFFGADLTGADLTEAHLNGANLSGAPLVRACLSKADLTGASLIEANLTGATLAKADLTGAMLTKADLTGAALEDANLTGADLTQALLRGATIYRTDLTGADLTGADLAGSWINNADLSNADFTQAKFGETIFEPTTLPRMNTLARAYGLRTLGWSKSDSKLAEMDEENSLRMENQYSVLDVVKALHSAGYSWAEAEANLAYHRHMQSWWQRALFDWTCEWGANWRRPIWIVLAIGATFALVYWSLLRFTIRSRLRSGKLDGHRNGVSRRPRPRRPSQLFVVIRKRDRAREWPVGRDFAPPPWFQLPRPTRRYWFLRFPPTVFRFVLARLRWEQPLFWTASLFSVMSVLNLGVQGLDLGRWLRLMQRREFDLRAQGTLRLIAGIQSVVSFLLLALTAYILLVQPIGE
jgi:uncharacterized protein YjbI with pentapeptide repeats